MEKIDFEARDGIAVITLNRPDERNAMNNELTTALRAAWERFNASDERVAILTHAGEHFSVGVDVPSVIVIPANTAPCTITGFVTPNTNALGAMSL